MLGMTGWKAFFGPVQENMDVFVERAGARAIYQHIVEKVDATGYPYGRDNANRGLKPLDRGFASQTGQQADDDKANQPRTERDNGGHRIIGGADKVNTSHDHRSQRH